MRPSLLIAAALLSAPLAHASDPHGKGETSRKDPVECSIEVSGNDRVSKGHDVVISAGETVDDAVAVDANVIIRSGAHVKSALALHGSVVVEDGAEVSDSVVAVGGKARVAKGAKVEGSTLAMDEDEGLHVGGQGSEDLNVSIQVDGESLARKLLAPVIAGIHRCRIVPERTN